MKMLHWCIHIGERPGVLNFYLQETTQLQFQIYPVQRNVSGNTDALRELQFSSGTIFSFGSKCSGMASFLKQVRLS